MTALQKRLKLFSFGIMGVGILQIIAGVFLITASPLAAGMRIEVAGDATEGVVAAEVLGVVGIIIGVCCLVIGVLGALSANNPRKVGVFKTLDLLLVVASVIEFGSGVANGELVWVDLVLAVLGVCAFATAVKANEEVANRL